jgi:hypothetical protein
MNIVESYCTLLDLNQAPGFGFDRTIVRAQGLRAAAVTVQGFRVLGFRIIV